MDNTQSWAITQLRENRDTPGDLYHDGGRHIVFLAKAAGTKVGAIHVDLTTLKTTHYTVTPEGKRDAKVAQRNDDSGNQHSGTVRTGNRAAVRERQDDGG